MGAVKDLWYRAEAALNKQDYAEYVSFFAADAIYIGPGDRQEGPDAILANCERAAKSFPDLTFDTSMVIEDGNVVAGEWVSRAKNTGPVAMPDGTEIPATGRSVTISGVTVIEVKDGKIASLRDYPDNLAVMSQLGLMPGT
jgi:steroid delta-isomerase-like uncharacterized protein